MSSLDKRFFVSYSSKDSEKVEAVIGRLRSDGLDVWFDQLHILPADNIVQRIDEGLSNWKYFLLFASASYFASSWTTSEYRAAFYAAIAANERKIIVIVLEEVQLPPLIAANRRIRYTTANAVANEIRRMMVGVDLTQGRQEGSDAAMSSSMQPLEWPAVSDDLLGVLGRRVTAQRGDLRRDGRTEVPVDVKLGNENVIRLQIPRLFLEDEVLLLDLQSELQNFEVVSRIGGSLKKRLLQGGLGIFEAPFEIELEQRQSQLAEIRATIRRQLSTLSPKLFIARSVSV